MTQWCKKPIDSSEIFSSSKLLRNTNSKSCKISIEKPCSATEMKVVAKMCVSSSLLQKPNWLVVQISYFYAILALSKLSFSAFCQCYIQCCHKIWLLLWNYELDADMSEMEPLIVFFCFRIFLLNCGNKQNLFFHQKSFLSFSKFHFYYSIFQLVRYLHIQIPQACVSLWPLQFPYHGIFG